MEALSLSLPAQYVLVFTPLFAMPLLVVLVRLIRGLWNRFQTKNEYGERDISPFHKRWRRAFAIFRYQMETSDLGRYWLVTQVILSVVACILYIVETYVINPHDYVSIVVITVVLLVFFTADYIIEFMLAEDRLKFTLSSYGIVDALSIPTMVIPILSADWTEDALIQFLMIIRAFRVFKVYKLEVFASDEVKGLLLSFFTSSAILVFLSTAFINAIERYFSETAFPQPDLENFHDSLYFMIASFTTVGYGDVVPSGTPTRIVTMFLLVGYMIFLPVNITRVARAIDSRGYHSAMYTISKKHPFFVLTGNVTYDNVVSFARELYNNSSEDKSTQLVILSSKAPSPEMAALLRNPLFNGRLFYLTGSCTSPNDLYRAKVHGARVCVIFRGPIESSAEIHDHKVLMYSVAIKKLYPDVPLFAQVLNSTEKEAIISSICDRIFCIQELNLRLMARSCIAPGASTLIANIFRSYTPVVPSASLSPWVNEYVKSCENEVNSFVLPRKYHGWTFSQVVVDLYTTHGVTLIGIRAKSGRSSYQDGDAPESPIILNPTDEHDLHEGDVAFVISSGRVSFSRHETHSLSAVSPESSRGNSPDLSPLLVNEEMNTNENLLPLPSRDSARKIAARISLPRVAAPRPLQLNKKLLTSKQVLLKEPVALETVTITEASFSNHIIVCNFKSSLSHFVSLLRLEALRSRPKIVIVAKERPTTEAWSQISIYPEVYFLKGDPTKFSFLVKAGIKQCTRVVVLADESLTADTSDAANILIGKNLQEEDERVHEIIEIALEANVEFLTPPTYAWVDRVKRTRAIVNDSSQTYWQKTSILDRNRNENAAAFIMREEFVSNTGSFSDRVSVEGRPLLKHHLQPFFASGNTHVSTLSDSLICQEIFRSYTMEIITKMISGDGGGQLFQIALPSQFIDKTYLELLRWLQTRNILLLGLYRGASHEEDLPYVIVNCPRDTELGEKDRIFVLASTEPEEGLV